MKTSTINIFIFRYESINKDYLNLKQDMMVPQLSQNNSMNKRTKTNQDLIKEGYINNKTNQTLDLKEGLKLKPQKKLNTYEKNFTEENVNTSKNSSKQEKELKELSKFQLSAHNLIFSKNDKN